MLHISSDKHTLNTLAVNVNLYLNLNKELFLKINIDVKTNNYKSYYSDKIYCNSLFKIAYFAVWLG